MFDPFLLSRFFVIAHAVVATGVGAWYLGVIPRGTPERRFFPLGLYMALTVASEMVTWAGFYLPAIEALQSWLRPLLLFTAVVMLSGAIHLHRRNRPEPETWPWKIRLALLLHFGLAFVVPVSLGPTANVVDRILPLFGSILALTWLALGNQRVLRRQGHFLHWSMGAAVLAGLAMGWIAIGRVQAQGFRVQDEDIRSRVNAFAGLLDTRLLDESRGLPNRTERLQSALTSICTSSTTLTGAFLLPLDDPANDFIIRVTAPAKHPAPIMASAATYTPFISRTESVVHRFTDPADGLHWHLATAPVRRFEDDRVVAIVGLLAPHQLIEATLVDSMLVTDSIVFFFALVVYGCIAGYLRGVVRIWQRDILLEINAEHSQKLLDTHAPHEIAVWLVQHMQSRLNLLHAAFWLHSERHGVPGFRLLASEPPFASRGPSSWFAFADLPAAWRSALTQGNNLEGFLHDLEEPMPGLAPASCPNPWVFVENVELHGRPYASIVTVFPERRLIARAEIRSALRSIANAFASCLVREERSDHLAAAEERLRTIIETSPDGFWDADTAHNRYYRSDRWWQMLGREPPAQNTDPHLYEQFIEPSDLEQLQAGAIEPLSPGRKFRRREYRARHQDGSWLWIESHSVELRSTHGPADRTLGFDRDITQRHHYENRLREAADTAARANQAKSEFLATMNHELRTPLNSVIGFATILDRSPLNPSQRDWVSSMRTSAEQLLGLISDVLDFSRIEAGRLDLEVDPFELRRTTEQALEHFSRAATEKAIALHLEFTERDHGSWVAGDAFRLRQILTNLVGNAVKFTTAGHVRLCVRPLADDHWEFEISDTGPGIPPAKLDALFTRFSQLDASTTRAHGGAGLGLAISRELARAMQGDITVSSEVDRGSTFTVEVVLPPASGQHRRFTDHTLTFDATLPVYQPDDLDLASLNSTLQGTSITLEACADLASLEAILAAATTPLTVLFPRAFRPEAEAAAASLQTAPSSAYPVTLLGLQARATDPEPPTPFTAVFPAPVRRRDLLNVIELTRQQQNVTAAPRVRDPSAPPFKMPQSPRVLVAEDHPVNRDVIRTMLSQLGLTADFAVNGQVALELLARQPYDIALVDIQMPVLDGYAVARSVRQNGSSPWPPPKLIAITANATRGDRERCLQAGMDDYAPKPITFAVLTELLQRHAPFPLAPLPASLTKIMPTPASPESSHPTESMPGDLLVDWANFDSILSFTSATENPEVLQRIIVAYETDGAALLDEVVALPADDHANTKRLLHKLKGSSGSLAFMGVVETIKKLHDPDEAPPPAQRAALLAQIRAQSKAAVAAVLARYPWLKGSES